MSCTPAPACVALLTQLTELFPNRSRASDGICGDASHQARKSDHNDGNAADATDDVDNGVDIHAMLRDLAKRKDKRVKYIISNKRIWHYLVPIWLPYFGTNPHIKHGHVSIKAEYRNDTSQWWVSEPKKEQIKMKRQKFRVTVGDDGSAIKDTKIKYADMVNVFVTDIKSKNLIPVVGLNQDPKKNLRIYLQDGKPGDTYSVVVVKKA